MQRLSICREAIAHSPRAFVGDGGREDGITACYSLRVQSTSSTCFITLASMFPLRTFYASSRCHDMETTALTALRWKTRTNTTAYQMHLIIACMLSWSAPVSQLPPTPVPIGYGGYTMLAQVGVQPLSWDQVRQVQCCAEVGGFLGAN